MAVVSLSMALSHVCRLAKAVALNEGEAVAVAHHTALCLSAAKAAARRLGRNGVSWKGVASHLQCPLKMASCLCGNHQPYRRLSVIPVRDIHFLL